MIILSVNVAEEKELIKKYQRTQSPLIYKELERRYQGVIKKAVLESGLSKYLADQSTITAQALFAFKKALEQYSESKNVQPNTFIINNIKFALKNYKNREMSDVAYRSEQTNRKAGLYYSAVQQMKTDPNADMSDAGIVKYIKSMKSAKGEALGKDFTRSDIKKIRDTERNELMGNALLNSSVGEALEVAELTDNHKKSAFDIMQNQKEKELITLILKSNKTLSLRQKSYIRRLIGIGRTPKAANESQARINAGITATEAFKAKQIIADEIKRRGF